MICVLLCNSSYFHIFNEVLSSTTERLTFILQNQYSIDVIWNITTQFKLKKKKVKYIYKKNIDIKISVFRITFIKYDQSQIIYKSLRTRKPKDKLLITGIDRYSTE